MPRKPTTVYSVWFSRPKTTYPLRLAGSRIGDAWALLVATPHIAWPMKPDVGYTQRRQNAGN